MAAEAGTLNSVAAMRCAAMAFENPPRANDRKGTCRLYLTR